MKKFIILLVFSGLFVSAGAQIDTTSFPDQRRELMELLHRPPAGDKSCGDLVAVGPKGDLSLSRKQWGAAQSKQQVLFKSIVIIPGSEIIRVYDKTTGVVNYAATVSLVVAGKDVMIKVRRLEVYHHTASGWCMVAGQGTEVDEQVFPVKELSEYK